MDAGQMLVTMAVAVPAGTAQSSSMGGSAVSDDAAQGGAFAGLLGGMYRQDQSGAGVQGVAAAEDCKADEDVAVQMEAALDAEIMAALLAEMGRNPGVIASQIQAGAQLLQQGNTEMGSDLLVSQDVASLAAVAPADGRTPLAVETEGLEIGMDESASTATGPVELKGQVAASQPISPTSAEGEGLVSKEPVTVPTLTGVDRPEQGRAVSALENKGSMTPTAAGKMVSQDENAVTSAEGRRMGTQAMQGGLTAESYVADKADAPQRQGDAGFRFARASAVMLEADNRQDVNGQPVVKQEAVVELEPEVAEVRLDVNDQLTEGRQTETESGAFRQPEGGADNRGGESFGRQMVDPSKLAGNQVVSQSMEGRFDIGTESRETASSQVVESGDVAGQVKTQLATREIKQGSEQITIKLSPEHLGDIKVNFRLDEQRLRVEIVAENRSARESLLQHADTLKESLARQNINMEKFDVTSGNGSYNGQGGNSQHAEWQELAKNRQTQQWMNAGGYRQQYAAESSSLPVYFARAEQSTLDLHF